MPQIIVQAHALDGTPGVVTMPSAPCRPTSKTTTTSRTLIERVGWALLDAEQLESQSNMSNPDGPARTTTTLTNRPDARTPGLAKHQRSRRQLVAEAEVSG